MTATHPQSPASPLPEAAEPVAKIRRYKTAEGHEHWEFVGERYPFFDLPHGEHSLYAAPSPVAQAPAQAGEAWTRAMNAALTYRNADPEVIDEQDAWANLIDALGALATQPLAAPVQQEAEAVGEVGKVVMFGGNLKEVSWRGGKMPPSGTKLYATPPAHPVLAPVVREPLSDERINLICRQELCQEDGHDYYAYSNAVHWWAEEGQIAAFVRAIEAAHGIQATTGEQSHG